MGVATGLVLWRQLVRKSVALLRMSRFIFALGTLPLQIFADARNTLRFIFRVSSEK
jgi:hypothetical protein